MTYITDIMIKRQKSGAIKSIIQNQQKINRKRGYICLTLKQWFGMILRRQKYGVAEIVL